MRPSPRLLADATRTVLELAALCLVLVVAYLAGTFFAGIAQTLAITWGAPYWVYTTGTFAANHIFGFVGVALVYVHIRGIQTSVVRIHRPSREEWVSLGLIGCVVVIALYLHTSGLSPGADSTTSTVHTYARTQRDYLLLAVLSLVIVAPCEEFVFRGVVQGTLRESLGRVAAIGVTSLLFALFHLPSITTGAPHLPMYLLTLFAVSVTFGWAYDGSDNLLIPISMHAGYNIVSFLVLYAA